MPRLLLLRHAKSSWGEPSLPDRERTLAPRGREAAARIAAEIARPDRLPDRVLCSPARRCRETLAALLPSLSDDGRVAILDELYQTVTGDYQAAIAAHGGRAERLLVIGHNPCIQTTALMLAGGESAAPFAAKYPTAGLAIIDFDRAWHLIQPRSGRLVEFLRPHDLADTAPLPEGEAG